MQRTPLAPHLVPSAGPFCRVCGVALYVPWPQHVRTPLHCAVVAAGVQRAAGRVRLDDALAEMDSVNGSARGRSFVADMLGHLRSGGVHLRARRTGWELELWHGERNTPWYELWGPAWAMRAAASVAHGSVGVYARTVARGALHVLAHDGAARAALLGLAAATPRLHLHDAVTAYCEELYGRWERAAAPHMLPRWPLDEWASSPAQRRAVRGRERAGDASEPRAADALARWARGAR